MSTPVEAAIYVEAGFFVDVGALRRKRRCVKKTSLWQCRFAAFLGGRVCTGGTVRWFLRFAARKGGVTSTERMPVRKVLGVGVFCGLSAA